MKLTRWAVSIVDKDGKRIFVGIDGDDPTLFRTKEETRVDIQWFAMETCDPRIHRVTIEIEETA